MGKSFLTIYGHEEMPAFKEAFSCANRNGKLQFNFRGKVFFTKLAGEIIKYYEVKYGR